MAIKLYSGASTNDQDSETVAEDRIAASSYEHMYALAGLA